ncbi:hypothetical protein [Rhizobium tropici]|uniref:hypothetical protein n=1 Tax=Rhizobium tropici TaxID=398 RepID=UPI00165F7AA4|nr:hypothetical protein [Rhizobium tropici]
MSVAEIDGLGTFAAGQFSSKDGAGVTPGKLDGERGDGGTPSNLLMSMGWQCPG